MRKSAQHAIQEEVSGIVSFIVTIWSVWIVSWFINLNYFGLTPREFWPGLCGIVTMPFLHAGIWHIVGNTIPLFILLVLLCGSKARSWEIVASIIFGNGVLLWLFGRSATHVGASGLVFGLAAFLISTAFFEKRVVPAVVALITGFLYGTTLLFGVLPTAGQGVSWDGHLCGVIAGVTVAWGLTKGLEYEPEAETV
jgi:membrane associated rhomboid family serine protease